LNQTKPVNYLSNKELLRLINESKLSYSSLVNPAFQDKALAHPDKIIRSLDEATEPDTVYRLMTREHIPPDITKPTFNAFKHFLVIDGHPIEVLRSHWIGGANDGHYSDDHGKISNTLAERIMLLVSKYSQRANFRGYSYREEFVGEGLVQVIKGALLFCESRTKNTPNPFAYYTAIATNAFRKVLTAEKRVRTIRDDMLISMGADPSHTRQTEDELEQRGETQPKPKRAFPKKKKKA